MQQAGEKLILMIEDSDEDYFATARAFKKSGYDFLRLKRTENVPQALDFLLTRGDYKNNDKSENVPALILLDLNLPGIDGREFLVQIKRDERLREISVVILTTSNNPRDVIYCYRNGANGYQLKAIGFEKYFDSIQAMIKYWFETATIPATLN